MFSTKFKYRPFSIQKRYHVLKNINIRINTYAEDTGGTESGSGTLCLLFLTGKAVYTVSLFLSLGKIISKIKIRTSSPYKANQALFCEEVQIFIFYLFCDRCINQLDSRGRQRPSRHGSSAAGLTEYSTGAVRPAVAHAHESIETLCLVPVGRNGRCLQAGMVAALMMRESRRMGSGICPYRIRPQLMPH